VERTGIGGILPGRAVFLYSRYKGMSPFPSEGLSLTMTSVYLDRDPASLEGATWRPQVARYPAVAVDGGKRPTSAGARNISLSEKR
jgi:hypothetical protein